MHDLPQRLQQLSSAEEFLDFFGVAYEPRTVHVNRLHILKRWRQYLQREGAVHTQGEVETYRLYRTLLQRALEDFTHSTAQREKVFKVFQDAEGGHVALDALRASLPSRQPIPRSEQRAAA